MKKTVHKIYAIYLNKLAKKTFSSIKTEKFTKNANNLKKAIIKAPKTFSKERLNNLLEEMEKQNKMDSFERSVYLTFKTIGIN